MSHIGLKRLNDDRQDDHHNHTMFLSRGEDFGIDEFIVLYFVNSSSPRKCTDNQFKYTCNCDNIGYEGPNCEKGS